jgi:hypothetical protein
MWGHLTTKKVKYEVLSEHVDELVDEDGQGYRQNSLEASTIKKC